MLYISILLTFLVGFLVRRNKRWENLLSKIDRQIDSSRYLIPRIETKHYTSEMKQLESKLKRTVSERQLKSVEENVSKFEKQLSELSILKKSLSIKYSHLIKAEERRIEEETKNLHQVSTAASHHPVSVDLPQAGEDGGGFSGGGSSDGW